MQSLVVNNFKKKLIQDLKQLLLDPEANFSVKIDLKVFNFNNLMVQEPKNKNFGDLSTNAAMILAPLVKQNPVAVAGMLVENIFSKWDSIKNIKIANPGFINFNFSDEFVKRCLEQIKIKNDTYGNNKAGNGKKIQIEFVSANPTGNLHIGHGRWGVLGDALSNIYEANGFEVEREYYINDFGTQIESFANCLGCLYLRYFQKYTPYPADTYPEDLVKNVAEEIFEKHGDKFLIKANDEPGVDLDAIGKEGVKIMLQRIKKTLSSLGVEFDVWFLESALYGNSNFDNILKELEAQKVVYKKDDALWFKSGDFGDDKDRVIIRRGGEPTYFASDILYLINKVQRGFKYLVYILGADHHGYIKRLHAIANALGYGEENVNVIIGQLVKLVKKGQVVRMSKRKGKVYDLDDLISEVGKDAVRYFFSMNSFDTPMEFDLDLAKQKTSQNPVYYVQYTHARISSLIEKVKELENNSNKLPGGKDLFGNKDNFEEYDFNSIDPEKFNNEELDIAKTLILYPDIIYDSCIGNAPYMITQYLYRLASQFHYFYNHYRIIDENKLDTNRFLLVLLVKIVLKNALKILNVSSPEKM
jgi:arginyl-tRNA synthetase